MINPDKLKDLNACEEGYHSFLTCFNGGASLGQIFRKMSKEHCIWLILALTKTNQCPVSILKLIPVEYSQDTKREFAYYISKNWDSLLPKLQRL